MASTEAPFPFKVNLSPLMDIHNIHTMEPFSLGECVADLLEDRAVEVSEIPPREAYLLYVTTLSNYQTYIFRS